MAVSATSNTLSLMCKQLEITVECLFMSIGIVQGVCTLLLARCSINKNLVYHKLSNVFQFLTAGCEKLSNYLIRDLILLTQIRMELSEGR